jgi:hypothetical protein
VEGIGQALGLVVPGEASIGFPNTMPRRGAKRAPGERRP